MHFPFINVLFNLLTKCHFIVLDGFCWATEQAYVGYVVDRSADLSWARDRVECEEFSEKNIKGTLSF